jgi:hypothetical protein
LEAPIKEDCASDLSPPVRLNQIKAYMKTLPPRVDPEGGDDLENDGTQP